MDKPEYFIRQRYDETYKKYVNVFFASNEDTGKLDELIETLSETFILSRLKTDKKHPSKEWGVFDE